MSEELKEAIAKKNHELVYLYDLNLVDEICKESRRNLQENQLECMSDICWFRCLIKIVFPRSELIDAGCSLLLFLCLMKFLGLNLRGNDVPNSPLCVKNQAELEGMRNSHIRDAPLLHAFGLGGRILKGVLSEVDVAMNFFKFRSMHCSLERHMRVIDKLVKTLSSFSNTENPDFKRNIGDQWIAPSTIEIGKNSWNRHTNKDSWMQRTSNDEGISQSEGNHSFTDSVRLWVKNNNEESLGDGNDKGTYSSRTIESNLGGGKLTRIARQGRISKWCAGIKINFNELASL
ncbi:hypothetical protein AAG906_010371 [Vitis piasezkii]